MPIGLGLAALIGSGMSLLGGIGSSAIQAGQSRRNLARTIKARKRMAAMEFKRNKKMWKMMNAYNTPLMQMQRFKEAGLNPNLIYGQGTPGNVGSYPTYNAPVIPMSQVKPFNPVAGLDEAVGSYFGIRSQEAQTSVSQAREEEVQAQTQVAKTREIILGFKSQSAEVKALKADIIEAKASGKGKGPKMWPDYAATQEYQDRVIREHFSKMKTSTLRKIGQQLQNQYDRVKANMATEQGISLGDSSWVRAGSSLLEIINTFLGTDLDLNPNN